VREIDEVVNDPHMHARGALQRVVHPDLGEIVLTAGPVRYGEAALRAPVPSRAAGADTAAVLADLLGLAATDIAALAAAGAL
jgi:crotonobetainyl-CoA:carnitine CoA-transferase CaiB-like acyl-CoA transferase